MACHHLKSDKLQVCPTCGELHTPEAKPDYFILFELAKRYNISKDELQKKFYQMSRELHPDKFQSQSPESLIAATEWFAHINKAYTTLSDDTDRMEYLISLSGISEGKEQHHLPPGLASDYFDLQESLEDEGLSPAQKKDKLMTFKGEIDKQTTVEDQNLQKIITHWEKSGATLDSNQEALRQAQRILRQKAYFKSMVHDLESKCQKLS